MVSTIVAYVFRTQIIHFLTDIESIELEALSAFWLFALHIYPDIMKGMMKGPIMALGIQYKAVYCHVVTNWFIYPISMWYFAFEMKMGISGLWLGKLCNEYVLYLLYLFIIKTSDWD